MSVNLTACTLDDDLLTEIRRRSLLSTSASTATCNQLSSRVNSVTKSNMPNKNCY